MSKESEQAAKVSQKFSLGPLGNLNQVIKALGKTIRAMADGSIDSQVGARICNGLGIMRACLERATLERLGDRLDHLENMRGHGNTTNSQSHIRAHWHQPADTAH
jgi:hypothetical protein